METLRGRTLRRRRAIGGGIAGAAAAAMILASALVPTAANAAPGDESASSSQFLSGSLLLGGVPLDDVADLQGASTSNSGVPTPETETSSLDLTALNALNLSIPGGLSVPLSGFLQLGAVNQYSQSSDAGVSRAATGAVSDTGVVDTTGAGAYPANASLNLQGLLGSAVTGAVADLDISLEAISAEVALDGAGTVARDYNVAGGDLSLTLPAIAELEDTLTGAGGVAATVDTAVGTLAGPNGLLAQALAGLNAALAPILGNSGVNISITTNVAGALNTILDTPVGDGVVTVNLRTGVVQVDLNALLTDTTGHGLNGLAVNEEVLSADVLNNLITRVGNVLDTVPALVQTTLTTTLNAALLNINVAVCVIGTGPTCTTALVDVGTGLQVSVPNQTLGSVVAGTATATIALKVAGIPITIPVGTLLGALTTPINATLFGPTGVIATVVPTVTTAVTSIVTALDPVVGLLNGVVSLRGNVQPDNGPVYSQEAFVLTVGDVLGAGGVGTVVLAHAQAGPNELAPVPAAIDAAATVQAGTGLPVTGTGWPANTDVEVQLTDPDGADVGGPETVTTDGAGGFTLDYPVPASAAPGTGYTVTAADGTSTATDTTEVTAAATVDAAPAVQAGTDLGISGTNWPVNTEISVQLTAPGGANIGGPELVTTDGSGAFTLDYPVPAGTPAATGYTVTATLGTQTATDTTEVTDAPVATIDAAATVQAGTDLAISGTTWPANTEITVQLTAPGGGADVGGPETVTTNGAGEFTLDYPVPASAVPGTAYTVTATAGAVTAIDTTEVTAAAAVDAADTVQAGTTLPVTGANWPANTDVEVQLTDPDGADVGGPQTVTTDGTGGFTLDYPVPATAVPGTGYTVTATVGGQTATDTTAVTAAAAVDAAPAVQAGTDLGISGTNWPANTQISVQLTAPGGGNIGGPELVTTDGAGTFVLDYPVPAGTPAATGYTVTATVGTQTASDTTEVTDAPVATIDAAATVQAGTDLAISGTNWPANTDVSVQLTAPGGGADVGGPETVTTNGAGEFTLDYAVPASATPGAAYTITATAGAVTAIDTTEVTAAATVVAADTVQAGTSLPVTGSLWPANTEVSVQLTDPDGADVGGPETVTTDGSGGFTLDYPVPATAAPGTGYTVTATVGGQTATDTTEVTAPATVDAAATVQAGSDLSVSGANWPANTEISVQLTAPGGAAIGTAQTVTTGGLGGFTLDYPVPAGTPAATGYTVTATAGTQTATDTTEVTAAPVIVDAAPAVPAGTNLAVTGSGWPVNATVSLQLTAPGAGADIGGPVTATTDGFGAFTANYPVPLDTAPAAGYTLTATSGAFSDTDTTEVTAGDPGDVNTNAAASASASADATADGDPSAQAAAEAAALADATSAASAAATADATSAADSAATPDASTSATTDATSTANASAAVAAQAAAQADASDDVNADASTAAESNSAASAESAATTDSSTDASSEAAANTNAAASASASADATADGDPSAQAAAEASAFSDATAVASADADASAESAAEAAALTAASTDASTTSTSTANASAAVAAQAAAQADASDDVNADASTAAESNSASSAESAATTDSSTDASSEAAANTNAAASASASANADATTAAIAEASAQAAAFADATADGSAAADPAAEASAESAATATATTAATADATSEANAGSAIAAQAAALADASTDTAAEASATSDASTSAASNASAAALASASTDASSDAVATADASADADPSAEADINASASAAASAQADDDSNAAVEAAAVAAALADATSTASAAADVSADAAASAAATDDASTDASTTATAEADASAAAAAQAAAQNDATSTSAADASASADADPAASADAASTATSSATASATAAAEASAEATAEASAEATAEASASADAAADPSGDIAITIEVPVLERGERQTAVGTGFLPGESVTGVMTSDPIALGTQIADAQGTVTFTWTVPADNDLGTHTVTLTGVTSGSVSATFQVVASGLATTGGEVQGGWIALAALLLMLGLGVTRVARSRRPSVQTE